MSRKVTRQIRRMAESTLQEKRIIFIGIDQNARMQSARWNVVITISGLLFLSGFLVNFPNDFAKNYYRKR